MDIITRSEWGALPPERPLTPWDPDDLLGLVVHHFAIPRSAATPAGSAALMRSVQRAHQAKDDGTKDIAYNHCFDKWGQIFEGRGFGFATGAHTPLNSTHASLCYMGDSDLDGFPEAAQDAAGWLIKQWLNRGVGMDIEPHGRISADPTGCPGDKAEAWVTSGAWKADLPANRVVQFLLVDDGAIVERSARVRPSESENRWHIFSERVEKEAHARMAAEGRRGAVTYVRKVTIV